MNYIIEKATSKPAGHGRGSSATIGAATVTPLAMRLHIPIAVALL